MGALTARDLVALGIRRLVRAGDTASLPKSLNLLAHGRFLVDLVRVRFGWLPAAAGTAYRRRHYRGYDAYLQHQAGKLARLDLTEYDRTYHPTLRDRLAALPREWRGARVLCLGARIGTEVKAFLDVGAFAVGVDINPGRKNRFVVHGDFHDLQYADASVDLVFSNSLDHVFDIDCWVGEVRRVLNATGVLLLEVGDGVGEGGHPEFYESLCWSSVPELIADFETRGFRLTHRSAFESPAAGHQLLFTRTSMSGEER